jgi:GNAT superfamily N-acetyltransferase
MILPEHVLIEHNLRTAMQFFGRASGCGSIAEQNGVLLIDSGVNYAVFNIAMLTSDVASAAELDARIAIACNWFKRRETRWSHWLGDDQVAAPHQRRIAEIFYRRQLHPLTEAPGMIAERLAPPTRALPRIVCRRVCDVQSRLQFAHLTTVCFDIPFVTSRMIYEPEFAWKGDYTGYIGYANGNAVCTTAAVVVDGAIGLYSVGTAPEHRKRGYAEALMRAVLAEIGERTGIERTLLQATRAGHSMYKKMGYRDVTRFAVYMS